MQRGAIIAPPCVSTNIIATSILFIAKLKTPLFIMLPFLIPTKISSSIPVTPLETTSFDTWLKKQSTPTKNWVKVSRFKAQSGTHCIIPNAQGKITEVILGIKDANDFWAFGSLPLVLESDSTYYLNIDGWQKEQLQRAVIAWGCGSYQFTEYKKSERKPAKLVIPAKCDRNYINSILEATFLVRDLTNRTAKDLGPKDLAKIAVQIAKEHHATVKHHAGNELIRGFPLVHAVGQGSDRPPQVVEFMWGKKNAPKVALIGKGICFDSGGLDLKPPSGMTSMKKDMAGAAHALALARMIMTANLPLRLHVVIPMAENLISGPSYKPGDVIKSRAGKTVEIGDTDAEGRLLLADSLARACEEKPELIIDFASLTGAATIAVGPEIMAMVSNNDKAATKALQHLEKESDPACRLPLYHPYREMLNSKIADLCNISNIRYAGAITAALFLNEFITADIPWIHFDIMGSNVRSKPGRPEGAEAMGLRGMFSFLQEMALAKK